eukprot:gnl/MRDRNA2_/MRDRNA2_94657_c0_seq1.p1 gnl/MRDRNA2_/MRDRNA2_94657_c0~~gnl/MRDRNA2_/MRDRNA2_94657_c0_seq1.p1  ORF type:complete len:1522 (+),score=530.41 gnl/MRDRNA2_/MRDRNA2_94657_c0_seq1:147-4712(+)
MPKVSCHVCGNSLSFLIVALTWPTLVVAQAPAVILWDFVKPIDFYKTCMTVTEEIGENSHDMDVAKSVCMKQTGAQAKAVGADIKEHCNYFAEQISQATESGEYHGGSDFCNKMLMFHSYKLKLPVLTYLHSEKMKSACSESISTAVSQGAGTPKIAAVQANIAVACKSVVENLFRSNGLPAQMAQPICKPFVEKANSAITAGELDPEDLGTQFCNGKAVAGTPFDSPEPSPMPLGFPLTKSDWKPKVTLVHLRKMVRHAYKDPKTAFAKFDKNGDGSLSKDEWKKMCKELAIPRLDCSHLFGQVDGDKNDAISMPEWIEAMGVTLPELVKMSNDKHRNAKAAWPIADTDGNGKLTPEEFAGFCKGLGMTPEQAENLFPKIDKDGNGDISEEEFLNVFGVDVPELKRRARKKHGPPNDSFKAMDKNGDGKLSPEEFEEGCKALDIPPEQAEKLMKEIDTDQSGDVDLEEWGDAMGMNKDDLRHAIFDKLGKPEDALKKMDKDGDGVVSPEEMKEALKAAGLTPEEAEAMMKEMDKDGDGKLSPEEFLKGAGADVMDEHRGQGVKGPAGGVTVPEFKDRAKKKHGTSKAAFDAFDKAPKDGKISPEEFKEGCKQLEPPVSEKDAIPLFAELDKNGNKEIDPEEFYEAMGGCATCGDKFGVPLPEFQERLKQRHGTPKAAYDAFDKDPKGKLSPEEFNELCADLKPPIPPEEAGPLFKQIDTAPTNGEISPEEFFGAVGGPEKYGLTVPEFKARAKRKHGTPKKAFDAMDADKDGQISPEEFEEGCKNLEPPVSPEEAKPLFNALDKDSSDGIDPEEFYKAVGGPEEFAPSPEEAVAAAEKAKNAAGPMDENGDGVVTPEEVQKAVAAGKVPPEMLKKMDKDGDGVISPEEAKQAAEEATAANTPKEKMKKALKKKFKTPKDAFDAMDTDGSGKLSPEEFKKGVAPEMSPEEAEKAMKEMDTDGDGVVSREEFYAANGPPDEFAPSPGEEGFAAPREAKESPVPLEEMKKRLLQAHGDGKKAWEALAGPPPADEMTCAQWEEKAKNYGIGPGEAKKLCKQMDANGDGIIGEDEFQNVMGVSDDELHDRFLDEFGNADEALKGTDLDGDGQVSEEELKKAMEDRLGLTPENAEKAAKEMMKKLDPDGDGKISGEDFKDATRAKADDLADRIADKIGSADDAMKKWDKDGDGQLTEEEFLKGAKDMGISEEAAKEMWKEKAGKDGTMDTAEFAKGFGIGPDEIMEKCFAEYGNPDLAFDEMDTDKDGLLSPKEWALGGEKMGLKPEQIERVFGEMDRNPNEHTHHHISKREFFDYLDFDLPNFKTWGDGYGDIDPWGTPHKKFNTLPHHHKSEAPSTQFLNSTAAANITETKGKLYIWPPSPDSNGNEVKVHKETSTKAYVKDMAKEADRAITSRRHKHVSSKSVLHHAAMDKLLKEVSEPERAEPSPMPQTRHREADNKVLVDSKKSATAPVKDQGRKEKMKAFRDMDINGDGVIEPEEFAAVMGATIPQDVKQHQRLRGREEK